MTTVNRARVSWIGSRALPTRINSGEGSPALSRLWTYSEAVQSAGGNGSWSWPWIGDKSFSHLWESNLGGGYRSTRNWDKAWKRVVPLHATNPPEIAASAPEATMQCHEYLFPSGVAAVVVADIQGEFSTLGLLQLVEEVGRRPVLRLGSRPVMPIPALISALLDGVETQVFGSIDAESVPTRRLETVATVVSTTDAPYALPQQGDETHQLLSGLCRFTSKNSPQSVGDLVQQLLPAASNFPDTARFVDGPARAVWSPSQSEDPYASHKLYCYHSNVSFSTLQVDMLLNTVRWASTIGWPSLSQGAKEVLRPQLNLLGLLYGKTDVYTTRFVRRHIEKSGLVEQISGLRVRSGVGQPLT